MPDKQPPGDGFLGVSQCLTDKHALPCCQAVRLDDDRWTDFPNIPLRLIRIGERPKESGWDFPASQELLGKRLAPF